MINELELSNIKGGVSKLGLGIGLGLGSLVTFILGVIEGYMSCKK